MDIDDLEQYRGEMIRLAGSILQDGTDVEEVVNDAITAIWLSAPRDGRNKDKLITAVRHRCLNRLRNKHRAARRYAPAELGDLVPDESDTSEYQALTGYLEQALDKLSPDDQYILRMRFWHGHTYAAIGGQLGISLQAVQKRVTRILRGLRKALGE